MPKGDPPPPPPANQIPTTQTDPNDPSQNLSVQGDLDAIIADTHGLHDSVSALQTALTPLQNSKLSDPDLGSMLDNTQVPRPNAQTTDPHRLTLSLPNSDHTMLSLGADADTAHIVERGIRGRTDQHIHMEVVTGTRTLVTQGSPMMETTIASYAPGIAKILPGYCMITDGSAWQDAKNYQFIIARENDLQLIAQTGAVGIKAYTDNVEIEAQHSANLSAHGNVTIDAGAHVTPEHKTFRQSLEGLMGQAGAAHSAKWAMKALDAATAVYSLGMTYRKTKKKAKVGHGMWENKRVDQAKFILDSAKLVSTLGRWASGSDWFKEGQSGTVNVNAETYASMTGGMAASLYGGLSASVTSVLSASLVGGTAGVKGLVSASVWSGLATSLKSAREVSVESEFGKAKLKAKTDLEVAAEDGVMTLTGNTKAQFNSVAGPAHIHGNTAVICVAGEDAGHGFVASPTKFLLAKIDSGAKNFESVTFVKDKQLLLDSKGLHLQYTNQKINLTDSKLEMTADSVEISASSGKARMNGNKVLIG